MYGKMQVSRLLKLFPSYASGPRGPVLPLIVHVLLPCLPWGMWWMVPLITPCSSSLSWWLLNSWLCFTRAQKFAFGKVLFIGRVLKQKILHFTLSYPSFHVMIPFLCHALIFLACSLCVFTCVTTWVEGSQSVEGKSIRLSQPCSRSLGPQYPLWAQHLARLSLIFHLPAFVHVELFPSSLTVKGFFLCCRITPFVITIFQFFYKEQVLLFFSEKNKIMLFHKTFVIFLLNCFGKGTAVRSFISFLLSGMVW